MKKILATAVTAATLTIALPAVASAHVIVTPNKADVGEELTFNVSVPNERTVPVSSVDLDIPKGVTDVIPTVIPGFTIVTESNDNNVTAITWTGSIPVGQRVDLSFSAQVPAKATQLDWKAYQTYVDGTVVHWDQKPTSTGGDDAVGTAGPYSVTKIVNDLSTTTSTTAGSNKDTLALMFSIAALVLSIGSLFLRPRKR